MGQVAAKKDKLIMVRMDTRLYRAVERYAKKGGLSVSEYVRAVLATATELLDLDSVKPGE